MREKITISTHVETQDTAGQPIVTYTTLWDNVPAAFDSLNGGEVLRGRQVESNVRACFTIHKLAGITTQHKIRHNGTDYGILYIKPSEGGNRYQEIFCTP
jgi:SPP1 family predicted phage head-tail adaptor